MVLGMKSAIKSNIWTTIYPEKSIDIFKGKKRENIVDLLGTIAIIGNATTTNITKFIHSQRFTNSSKDTPVAFPYDSDEIKETHLRLRYHEYLRNNFNRLLTGRLKYTHIRKKTKEEKEPKKYLNPVDLGYIIITGKPENTKGKFIPKYFLTLKGFFLVAGYEFNQSELKSVIENASKVSIFFCFIKTVMDKSSLDFVNEIFIKPLRPVLVRSDIFQGHDMDFYFSNFADAISRSLSEKMKTIDKIRQKNIDNKPVSYFYNKITDDYRKLYPHRDTKDLIRFKIDDEKSDIDDLISHFRKEGIESLMDNVFYCDIKKEDWYESIIEHFYTDQELKFPFLDFAYDAERYLVDKVMQNIQFTYYPLLGKSIPKNPRKRLLRSKSWKRHQKFKKSNGTFSDRS